MKSFSRFCIALSAAVLLTGGLPGQAQSQEGLLQLPHAKFSKIASYEYKKKDAPPDTATGVEIESISAHLDLFRGLKGGKHVRSLPFSLTITLADKEKITLPDDVELGPDGTYEKDLGGGRSISVKVPSFLETAFSSDWSKKGISGTYTYTDLDDSKIEYKYATHLGSGWNGFHDPLSVLMYFDSWKYETSDYTDYLEYSRNPGRKVWNEGHMMRGGIVSEKGKLDSSEEEKNDDFHSDLRLYLDGLDTEGQPIQPIRVEASTAHDCEGMSCTVTIGEKQNVTVLEPKHFLPSANDVHVVMPHQGIYLALDRSGNNVIDSHLSFGAWMDDAGFFVAVKGTYAEDGVEGKGRDARMVVAVGERTDSRPAADAVWRGSMVGTVLEGDEKDHLLRGDAHLRFDMNSKTLDAVFFNIRDYDRFGTPHEMDKRNPEWTKWHHDRKRDQENYRTAYLEGDWKPGPGDSIRFTKIPVKKEDGSYEKMNAERQYSIRGAFYGTDHAETAGTFEKYGIAGAFGAKKVILEAAVPEAPEN